MWVLLVICCCCFCFYFLFLFCLASACTTKLVSALRMTLKGSSGAMPELNVIELNSMNALSEMRANRLGRGLLHFLDPPVGKISSSNLQKSLWRHIKLDMSMLGSSIMCHVLSYITFSSRCIKLFYIRFRLTFQYIFYPSFLLTISLCFLHDYVLKLSLHIVK